MRRNKGLVGGDHMLAGGERCGHIAESGLDTAHDFRNRADRRVIDDTADICYFIGAVVFSRTDKDGALFQAVCSVKHFIYSDTHSTKP